MHHHQIQIISMENNSIRAKGTYRVIESKDYELIQEWNSIIAKENAKDENVWYVSFGIFSLVYSFVLRRLLWRTNRKYMCVCEKKHNTFSTHVYFDSVWIASCHFELITNNMKPFFSLAVRKQHVNDGSSSKTFRKSDYNGMQLPMKMRCEWTFYARNLFSFDTLNENTIFFLSASFIR